MFYKKQAISSQKEYEKNLILIGSLSNLFSDSHIPYLYYRIAEKIFCSSFLADDLSRGDVALDAHKDFIGLGLKTFLATNYKTFQKVAEFNKDKFLYEDKSPEKMIRIISSLRNERIIFTEKLYNIKDSLYHCVVRDKDVFKIYEEKISSIDIEKITEIKKKKSSITFHDELHEYSFNISKSTLTKKFITDKFQSTFEVKRLKNPLEELRECLKSVTYEDSGTIVDTIYLPLYGRDRKVHEKSGLNQWNASGRTRDINEVYIPIPIKIHKLKKDFFPSKEDSFELVLPNKRVLKSKVCQANSKALMSYSNKELGQWILRDVLQLKEEELLTYEKLQNYGVDSVRIDKLNNGKYEINFASVGKYEEFIGGR